MASAARTSLLTMFRFGARVIGLRLAGALAAILLLFAVALVLTQAMLGRIADAELEIHELDQAKHAGHALVSAAREQHIQQLHVVMGSAKEHRAQNDRAVLGMEVAAERLVALASGTGEAERARRIIELARSADRRFRDDLLPAVERGNSAAVDELGRQLMTIVDDVAALNGELDRLLEQRSNRARERATRAQRQATLAAILCFGAAFVLAAVVGTLLTSSIVRPVSALRAGALRVGAGDLSTQIDVPGHDEFAQLAATFNQMSVDLARHQAALLRSQKLASIGQVAAGVAHEINNPLTVILGHAVLARRNQRADAEPLRIIEAEARACQRIVQDLLDLARPQRLDIGDVDLGELARAAVARLHESGALAGRSITFTDPASAVRTVGDTGRLRQVISNLVLNAAQASPEGGSVALETQADHEHATLTIFNDGPAIPAGILARIFEPFFTTKPNGVGLGLAIAQAIADAHGGRIELESPEGGGVRARLRLPIAPHESTAS